ncbi:unnamed protein product, partial [Rotaria socialis]
MTTNNANSYNQEEEEQ